LMEQKHKEELKQMEDNLEEYIQLTEQAPAQEVDLLPDTQSSSGKESQNLDGYSNVGGFLNMNYADAGHMEPLAEMQESASTDNASNRPPEIEDDDASQYTSLTQRATERMGDPLLRLQFKAQDLFFTRINVWFNSVGDAIEHFKFLRDTDPEKAASLEKLLVNKFPGIRETSGERILDKINKGGNRAKHNPPCKYVKRFLLARNGSAVVDDEFLNMFPSFADKQGNVQYCKLQDYCQSNEGLDFHRSDQGVLLSLSEQDVLWTGQAAAPAVQSSPSRTPTQAANATVAAAPALPEETPLTPEGSKSKLSEETPQGSQEGQSDEGCKEVQPPRCSLNRRSQPSGHAGSAEQADLTSKAPTAKADPEKRSTGTLKPGPSSYGWIQQDDASGGKAARLIFVHRSQFGSSWPEEGARLSYLVKTEYNKDKKEYTMKAVSVRIIDEDTERGKRRHGTMVKVEWTWGRIIPDDWKDIQCSPDGLFVAPTCCPGFNWCLPKKDERVYFLLGIDGDKKHMAVDVRPLPTPAK